MPNLPGRLPLVIFILLHFSFLTAALVENIQNEIATFFLVFLTIITGMFYRSKFNLPLPKFKPGDILSIAAATLGALATFGMHLEFNMSAVLAAGITGLMSSVIPYINPKSDLGKELPPAIYCGAFTGMTAPLLAGGYIFILLAGIATGSLLIISKNAFNGFGGKLGTIAFGGVSLSFLILLLLNS